METEAPLTTQMLADRLSPTQSVHQDLTAAHAAARAAIDNRLYELCRLRVAMLLGNDAELAVTGPNIADVSRLRRWPTEAGYSATERACLAFCEQFVIDVASLDHSLADDVIAQLGAEGFSDFVHALLVIEQRQRLTLAWSRLFPTEVVA